MQQAFLFRLDALWGYITVGSSLLNRVPFASLQGGSRIHFNASLTASGLFGWSIEVAMVAAFAGAQEILRRQLKLDGPVIASIVAVVLTLSPLVRLFLRGVEDGTGPSALAYGGLLLSGYVGASILSSSYRSRAV